MNSTFSSRKFRGWNAKLGRTSYVVMFHTSTRLKRFADSVACDLNAKKFSPLLLLKIKIFYQPLSSNNLTVVSNFLGEKTRRKFFRRAFFHGSMVWLEFQTGQKTRSTHSPGRLAFSLSRLVHTHTGCGSLRHHRSSFRVELSRVNFLLSCTGI